MFQAFIRSAVNVMNSETYTKKTKFDVVYLFSYSYKLPIVTPYLRTCSDRLLKKTSIQILKVTRITLMVIVH